jgi:hypothetical protein
MGFPGGNTATVGRNAPKTASVARFRRENSPTETVDGEGAVLSRVTRLLIPIWCFSSLAGLKSADSIAGGVTGGEA